MRRALSLCKGMFAAAFWDRKERTLTLARDRVGEKPLYYGRVAGSFVFASDLGSIAVLDGFEGRIDRSVLPFYFTHGYIPTPCSIYENIRKLPAGCLLTIKIPAGTEAFGNGAGDCALLVHAGGGGKGASGVRFREAGRRRRTSWSGS